MTAVTYKATVRVKRVETEFAPGMGVGVLATQEITLQVPDGEHYEIRAGMQIKEFGQALLEDSVEVLYERVA